ncbi:MAG: redoxin family protein [Acidobacteriota bacterium]|nr:redoxin family protein [Acidobacteriota bacterium]
MEVEPGTVHAPELGPEWINSPPLTIKGLRGRTVLVDFWDYTCVNCLRTLPYVVEWHNRYADKGLTIVGVHTPEFSFARSRELVEGAMERFGIRYPVVMDNDYAIWQAFANRCWPAKYLVDANGYLRFAHFGEGEYQETERAVQTLLREMNPSVALPEPLDPLRETDRPGAACYRTSPEIYLGARRATIGNEGGLQNQEDRTPFDYKLTSDLAADKPYLAGPWISTEEYVRSASNESQPSALLIYYLGKEVNLVMASIDGEQPASLLQNGAPVAREDAGEDVRFDENGRSFVLVSEPRMYRLVRNREFSQRLLQVVTRKPGLLAYAFTFVTCVAEAAEAAG